MSVELSSLGRLRVALETGVSAYGVDQSASPSNFIDVPIVEGSLAVTRTEDLLDPQTMQLALDNFSLSVRGVRSCSVNFSSVLASTGSAYTGAASPALATTDDWALHRLFTTIMGGVLAPGVPNASTAVVAGSTTTVINVTTGHGVHFTQGSVIGCIVNGRVEAREILTKLSDAITVKVAFSGIPATGSQIYYGHTFYLTENPLNSLQFMHDGMEDYDKHVYGGLQGGFTLDLATGQLPKVNFALNGAYWAKLANATIAAGTIANHSPAAHMDTEFLVGTVGSSTRNVVHVSSETWTPNIQYIDIKSKAGVGTVLRKRRGRGRVIAGKFTMLEDSTQFDFAAAAAAKTELAMFSQLGSVAGNIVLLSAPNCQVKVPQKTDNNGAAGLEVEWMGRNDNTAVASGYAGLYTTSAFKIHML